MLYAKIVLILLLNKESAWALCLKGRFCNVHYDCKGIRSKEYSYLLRNDYFCFFNEYVLIFIRSDFSLDR